MVLVALSRLNLFVFYRRVIFLGFVFGFLIALPSSLNVVTSGEIVIPLVRLSRAYDFWIYHLPEWIGITRQGAEGVALLTMRVMNSAALSLLVIYTTPFEAVIRALKSLRVPDAFLVIITLSYKYMFIFAKTIEDIHLAKKSKAIDVDNAEVRSWIAGRMAFLFGKVRGRCEEVFAAMLARGFSGDIRLHAEGKLHGRDVITGSVLFIFGILLLFI